jgi:hypothetical protein
MNKQTISTEKYNPWRKAAKITKIINLVLLCVLLLSVGRYCVIQYMVATEAPSSIVLPDDMLPITPKTAITLYKDKRDYNVDKYYDALVVKMKEANTDDSYRRDIMLKICPFDIKINSDFAWYIYISTETNGNTTKGTISFCDYKYIDPAIKQMKESSCLIPFYYQELNGEYKYYLQYAGQWYTTTLTEQDVLLALTPSRIVKAAENAYCVNAPFKSGVSVALNETEAPFNWFKNRACTNSPYWASTFMLRDDFSIMTFVNGSLTDTLDKENIRAFAKKTHNPALEHLLDNYNTNTGSLSVTLFPKALSITIPEAVLSAKPLTEEILQAMYNDIISIWDDYYKYGVAQKNDFSRTQNKSFVESIISKPYYNHFREEVVD